MEYYAVYGRSFSAGWRQLRKRPLLLVTYCGVVVLEMAVAFAPFLLFFWLLYYLG